MALCSTSTTAGTPGPAGKKPNIILIMTDDQGMGDMSCMGNPILKTPNIDRFYSVSTRFTDFHVSPTCAPTRSAIMSGRHEFKNGVTHTILERERMSLNTITIAEVLQNAGYKTGIFGKWHLGDEEPYQPGNRGFDEVFIHGAGGIGQAYDCSCADYPPNRQNRYFDPVIRHNDTLVKTKGFCTDVFFREALGWIKKHKDGESPFFAYIVPNAPHGPMIAPEKYKKPWLDKGYDENTAGRYGMIVNIDDNMGRLMQKLGEWKLWEQSLVIFMTDNGQALRTGKKNGESFRQYTAGFKTGKGSPYEGGTHVPAFWRWQGVLEEGTDIDTLTAHIDLFPTFAELAGAHLPEGVQKIDGRSLLPLLENPNADWTDRKLFVHRGRWPKGADPDEYKYKNFAIRTERWRLVNKTELYDIQSDPFEKNNVIDKHPQIVRELLDAYDAWWYRTRPLMVNEDVPNAEVKPAFVRYKKQLEEKGIPDWTPPEL
ncbi:MAG: arylsulfatase [Verrucomicrobia bacterium]|nr:arylsulfatase [Verrucomicrobiota bacterium]